MVHFLVFFFLSLIFSSQELSAVIKLRPIKEKQATKVEEEKSTNTITDKNVENYNFILDTYLPTVNLLSGNFIIPRLKKNNDSVSIKVINKINFIKGNFDEINVNPMLNLDQLWMLAFSKFNHPSDVNVNNLPEISDKKEKLKYRFLLAVLKNDTARAEFVYNIYADSFYDNKEQVCDSFMIVAQFYLYDMVPDKKLFISDIDFNGVAILKSKRGVNRLIESPEENYKLYINQDKEKWVAMSLLDGVDDIFAIKVFERSKASDLLLKKYIEVGRSLVKKGVSLQGDSFGQLSNELKRALLFYNLFINVNNKKGKNDNEKEANADGDNGEIANMEFVSSFIKLCARDKVFIGYQLLYPIIKEWEPSNDNLWIAQDVIKIFAFVGDREIMILWLNYLREKSPSDWVLVSVFDVFSKNKSFVDPLKTTKWLDNISERIKSEELDPEKRALKLKILSVFVDKILLGRSIATKPDDNNNRPKVPFKKALEKLIADINVNLERNNIEALSDNFVMFRSLGLGEYIPALVLDTLAYYDF